MGPRSNDRGNTAYEKVKAHLGLASMGPRSNDRGNGRSHFDHRDPTMASMGPRSNDRGNGLPAVRSAGSSALQWGRDQMIAEIPVLVPHTMKRGCFNGAAIK